MTEYEKLYQQEKRTRGITFVICAAVAALMPIMIIGRIGAVTNHGGSLMDAIGFETVVEVLVFALALFFTIRGYKGLSSIAEDLEKLMNRVGVYDEVQFNILLSSMHFVGGRFYINADYIINTRTFSVTDMKRVQDATIDIVKHHNKNRTYYEYICNLHFDDGKKVSVASNTTKQKTEAVYNEIMIHLRERERERCRTAGKHYSKDFSEKDLYL